MGGWLLRSIAELERRTKRLRDWVSVLIIWNLITWLMMLVVIFT